MPGLCVRVPPSTEACRMSDLAWWGVTTAGHSEPYAVFATEQEARLHAYTYDTVKPVRLRILASLSPAPMREED